MPAGQNFIRVLRTVIAMAPSMSLRGDLADAEEKIAYARQFYNRTVLDYNTRIATYPDAIIASSFNFPPAEFFGTDEEGRAEVLMDFSKRPVAPHQPASPPAS